MVDREFRLIEVFTFQRLLLYISSKNRISLEKNTLPLSETSQYPRLLQDVARPLIDQPFGVGSQYRSSTFSEEKWLIPSGMNGSRQRGHFLRRSYDLDDCDARLRFRRVRPVWQNAAHHDRTYRLHSMSACFVPCKRRFRVFIAEVSGWSYRFWQPCVLTHRRMHCTTAIPCLSWSGIFPGTLLVGVLIAQGIGFKVWCRIQFYPADDHFDNFDNGAWSV